MEETVDLSGNSSSSHRQIGNTMKEDVGMPDTIHILVEEFEQQSIEMGMKIHRLPASLADMESQFVIPMALSIGPYHHGLPRLQGMEKAKRVAAYMFTRDSGHSYKEVYGRVLDVADQARRLYADDAVSGFSPDQFADMMFHDACFLLQYMHFFSLEEPVKNSSSSLQRFFFSNHTCIINDIMLLENQLPWLVIKALVAATEVEVHLEHFIVSMGNSMSGKDVFSCAFDYTNMVPSHRQPHLLGRIVLHKQGVLPKQSDRPFVRTPPPISAMELEGFGFKLEHAKTNKFNDMGISKGLLFDKLFLTPLILDRTTASWLVNMVAFEVCMAIPGFGFNDSTSVCSYVAVLAMLMVEEEDVHKLRSKGFIGGELSDKQILKFFNRLAQQMIHGTRYNEIVYDIINCKRRRWVRIMVCKFVSDNAKAIVAVLSIIGVLVGIFRALYSLKQH